jgi:hypothetical protein
MLSQIEDFVNWVRRRNPQARTWRDYSYDLAQFAAVVGDRHGAVQVLFDGVHAPLPLALPGQEYSPGVRLVK